MHDNMSMSQSRFDQKFAEQIGYLQRSAQHFDDGHEDEALRLATSLRVLLHDTPKSVSLFTYTGRKGAKLLTSSRGFRDWKDYLAQEINLSSPQPVRMKPLLGTQFKELSVDDWWDSEPVRSSAVPPTRMVGRMSTQSCRNTTKVSLLGSAPSVSRATWSSTVLRRSLRM